MDGVSFMVFRSLEIYKNKKYITTEWCRTLRLFALNNNFKSSDIAEGLILIS